MSKAALVGTVRRTIVSMNSWISLSYLWNSMNLVLLERLFRIKALLRE